MLNNEILLEDPLKYRNYLRLTNENFELLLNSIRETIEKQDTVMRCSISARNQLETTLRFLATGETFRSLMYSTRIHERTISKFILQVCRAIYDHLKEKYLRTPNTSEEWTKISDSFFELWQFPHCTGALDGRHITFRPPRSDGSYYYNYKGEHSIILLAMADAHYRFTYVNVGCNGRISDGGVFRESQLSKALNTNSINFPQPEPLPGRKELTPYVIVADDAFPLTNKIMKPFPQRGLSHNQKIFNYRLSRTRRIIENSFGILANKFRVLLNPINLRVSKVEQITLTAVVLHNFLITQNNMSYIGDTENEKLKSNVQTINRVSGNKSSNEARAIREEFMTYFCSDSGSVPWQENAIRIGNM